MVATMKDEAIELTSYKPTKPACGSADLTCAQKSEEEILHPRDVRALHRLSRQPTISDLYPSLPGPHGSEHGLGGCWRGGELVTRSPAGASVGLFQTNRVLGDSGALPCNEHWFQRSFLWGKTPTQAPTGF